MTLSLEHISDANYPFRPKTEKRTSQSLRPKKERSDCSNILFIIVCGLGEGTGKEGKGKEKNDIAMDEVASQRRFYFNV